MNFAYLFKYIVVGDQNVGKSCLLLRFLHQEFRPDTEATVGVEFASKTIEVNGMPIKLQIWDTAGQEAFQSITRSYYRGTIGAILVYDVTSPKSFDNIARWLDQTKNYATTDNIILVLVGNKTDLPDKAVTSERAAKFAKLNGMVFLETSALNGKNVSQIFQGLSKRVLQKVDNKEIDVRDQNGGVKLGDFRLSGTEEQIETGRKCC